MHTRRHFLLQAAAAALPSPPRHPACFDLHFHANNRSVEEALAHCRALNATRAVLLGGAASDETSTAAKLQREHRTQFVAFAREDPRQPDAAKRLRDAVKAGALGIGEQKHEVPIDGPEMRAVYDVAAEHRVPVLLHIGGAHNSGYERFPAILKKYPSVTFIGHANGFWGHVSADYDGKASYPTGPVKPGGLTDRWLAEHPNLYADLSARSGLGALTRDEAFARGFVRRHSRKLFWGTDCPCKDGHGKDGPGGKCLGQESQRALAAMLPDRKVLEDVLYGNLTRLLGLDGGRKKSKPARSGT
jgi:predicted TIM-barrel fold metal-dependent hydrolase